jgi:hypothetical protein
VKTITARLFVLEKKAGKSTAKARRKRRGQASGKTEEQEEQNRDTASVIRRSACGFARLFFLDFLLA